MNPITETANDPQRVQWGVLGCATVARKVMVPGIQRSNNGEVLAVASRRVKKADDFAQSFDIERAYGSYEQLLDDDDVQAVYIPLANSLHCEWTIYAASRGKHVLCEKPLACSASEARDMVEACHKHGVLLMEAFAHRFHPHNVQVRQLIDDGRIGKVLRMSSVHSSARPAADDIRLSKELSGGVLMDKGCYCVNTARFIFGSEPVRVYATMEFGEFGRDSGVDERVVGTLEFPCGGVLQFDSGFKLAENNIYQQGYEVFGEHGHIYMPTGIGQVETYRTGKLVETYFFVSDDAVAGAINEKIHCPPAHQFQFQAEYFADRVLKGKPIEQPAENGLANMKVIDALYDSARQGRSVKVACQSNKIRRWYRP